MATVSLSLFETFLPIISFFFIFFVVFALLKKTEILGDNGWVAIFLSFAVSTFFILNSQLVDFVQLNASWAVVFIVCLLFILLFVGLAGKDALKVVQGNKSFAWVLLGILVVAFVISSSYVFNWVLNWEMIKGWFDEPWFGAVLVLAIAYGVSKVLITVKK